MYLCPEALIDSSIVLEGIIIYNKLDNYFFVSVDRQTFLGFKMTAKLRDTSLLRRAKSRQLVLFTRTDWPVVLRPV